MTAAATRKRILDAAERVFADSGYAGASIRSITKLAGSDLGAVRYHFGNKDALFGAVLKRRLEPLCEERLAQLRRIEESAGEASPAVEDIVEAFLLPAIRLITHEGYGRSWMKLMGRVRVEPGRYLESVQDVYERLLRLFLAAFRRALPEIPPDEVAYRLYFMFGTEVNTMINDGSLRAVGEDLHDVSEDPDGMLARLVRFVSAGMRAACRSSDVGEPAAQRTDGRPRSLQARSR